MNDLRFGKAWNLKVDWENLKKENFENLNDGQSSNPCFLILIFYNWYSSFLAFFVDFFTIYIIPKYKLFFVSLLSRFVEFCTSVFFWKIQSKHSASQLTATRDKSTVAGRMGGTGMNLTHETSYFYNY